MLLAKYEGYMALAVAIGCVCTVESAFERLVSKRPSMVRHPINKEDIVDMHQLKAHGLTYPEIGEIYGLNSHAVFRRMKRLA